MKNKLWLLSLLPLLIGCNNGGGGEVDPDIPTHEYSEITHLIREWENLFKQEDNHYYFYCYGEHCKQCHKIKNEVIDIALKGKKLIYFCDKNYDVFPEGDPSETLGKTDVIDVFILGTPSLLEIKNHTIINNVAGSEDVINVIKSD